jgi:hypothetical protein
MSIAIEYDLLKEAWTSFSDMVQDKQSASSKDKATLLEWKENNTIDELRDSVRAIADKLDQSHGETRRHFDKFCSSLSSHSAILEILPNQNQYLSIFCGVAKTLLKVILENMLFLIKNSRTAHDLLGFR